LESATAPEMPSPPGAQPQYPEAALLSEARGARVPGHRGDDEGRLPYGGTLPCCPNAEEARW